MYKIGEVAKRFSISQDTLRYYEKLHILKPSLRNHAGYRLYTDKDLRKLQFIMQAKTAGFTLSEIDELLEIDLNKREWACIDVKNKIDAKLAQVQAQIAELHSLSELLTKLSQSCCSGKISAEYCSILQTLESSLQLKKY